MAHDYGSGGAGDSGVRYFCGGAWGQQENLTADEVARIVAYSPGPHYVWAPGLPEWTPAEQVHEIAAAVQQLGGVTVEPAEPIISPTTHAGPLPRDTQRKLVLLGAGLIVFIIMLLVAVLLFGGSDPGTSSGQAQVEPTPAPTPAPPPEPTPSREPPRIDATSRRPIEWRPSPLRNPRGLSGTTQASSELRESGGKVHGSRNVADKYTSTAWCEGNPENDGEGEWIQLAAQCLDADFIDIIGLEIVSGYGEKKASWKQNNRPAEARLTVRVDGNVRLAAVVQLADRPGFQFLEFPKPFLCERGQTVRARLDITQLYVGEKYSDACISGMAIYERNPR